MAGWHISLLPLTLFLKIERSFTVLRVKDRPWHLEIVSVRVGKICLYWHWSRNYSQTSSLAQSSRSSGVWIKKAESSRNVNRDTFPSMRIRVKAGRFLHDARQMASQMACQLCESELHHSKCLNTHSAHKTVEGFDGWWNQTRGERREEL